MHAQNLRAELRVTNAVMHATADNSTIPQSPKKHGSQAEQDMSESCPSWGYTAVGTAIAKWGQSLSVAPVPAQRTKEACRQSTKCIEESCLCRGIQCKLLTGSSVVGQAALI